MTKAQEYGSGSVTLPPINEVELHFLRQACSTVAVQARERADQAQPGSSRRANLEKGAEILERLGRKLAFPTEPKQW